MDIGLYLSAFILIFGALCWLASVVCAWLCQPKRTVNIPSVWDTHIVARTDIKTSTTTNNDQGWVKCPSKLEPDYLADCEWPTLVDNDAMYQVNDDILRHGRGAVIVDKDGNTTRLPPDAFYSENPPKNHYQKEI